MSEPVRRMFLTQEEVEELTGAKQRARQISWLGSQGIRFWVNIGGRPIVPVSEIEGPGRAGRRPKELRIEPNWDALKPEWRKAQRELSKSPK